MTPEEKQSGIPCVLVGTDGNIYALLGRARQALRRGGRPDLVEPMTKEVLASKSYEEVYCDRGNAELFIKDHKNGLKSGRASCHKATANQFRLFLHSAAYMLMHALRDKLPDGAQLAHAQFDTIRMSREFRTVFLRESFCITLFFGAAFRPPCVIIGAP